MNYYRTEIRTGIMVLVCIAILIFFTFYVGGAKLLGNTYNIGVAYKNIGGLDPDSPVHFAGLKIGIVDKIQLLTREQKEKFPDCTILVNLKMDKLTPVKTDSKIQIKSLGFMGLKYIDISPGTNNAELVPANSILKGEISQDINEVMDSVGQIVDEIKPKTHSIVAGIDNIIGENGSLQGTINDLKKLINDADEVIFLNKGDITKMISNLSAASEHLKAFSEDIKKHPWKLLIKSEEKKKSVSPSARQKRRQ